MSDGKGGLLGRLRDWVGSLFGGGSGDAVADEAVAGTCAVCGTPVEDPGSGCPLCGSTDVDRGDGDASDDEGTPEPERRSVEGTADDAATRLRNVRGGGPDGSPPSGTDAGAAAGNEGSAATDDAGNRRTGDG